MLDEVREGCCGLVKLGAELMRWHGWFARLSVAGVTPLTLNDVPDEQRRVACLKLPRNPGRRVVDTAQAR